MGVERDVPRHCALRRRRAAARSTSRSAVNDRCGISSPGCTGANSPRSCSASCWASAWCHRPSCAAVRTARGRCSGSSTPTTPSTTSRSSSTDPTCTSSCVAIAVLDLIANNTDRKSGHCLLAGDRVWAIDNGLCFAAPFKLRTVIWEFADEPIDESGAVTASRRWRRRCRWSWRRCSTTTRWRRCSTGRPNS